MNPFTRPLKRWQAKLLLASVAALIAAAGALAFFQSSGSGAGMAMVGTINPPSNVVAKAANGSTTLGASPVTITWTPPSSGAAPTGYTVVRDDGHGGLTTLSCSATPCTDSGVPDATYTYHVSSLLGSSWTSAAADSNSLVVDSTPPTISGEVVADATANTAGFITQGAAYYAYAQVTDGGSGVDSVSADLHTTTTGASAAAMTTSGGPWTIGGQSYNYRSTVQTANASLPESGNPYSFSVSATDVASNSASANGTVDADNSGPTGGGISFNDLGGTGGVYTQSPVSLNLAAGSDGGVGNASAGTFTLARASATLGSSDGLADGTCGTLGSFSTIATGPGASYDDSTGISNGQCYEYRYTVTDLLGNQTTYTSSEVKVDLTSPNNPGGAASNATGDYTYISGSSVFINAQGSNSGSFEISDLPTDPESGIANVSFESLPGFTGGGTVTGSPYSSTYTWSGSSTGAADGQGVAPVANDNAGIGATAGAVFVHRDITAPTGSITEPSTGSTVPGSGVTLSADSADTGSGVRSAQFQYTTHGGSTWTNIGSAVTESPFQTTWDTTSLADGAQYDLRVITTDNVGNTFTSSIVTVTVPASLPFSSTTPGTYQVLVPAGTAVAVTNLCGGSGGGGTASDGGTGGGGGCVSGTIPSQTDSYTLTVRIGAGGTHTGGGGAGLNAGGASGGSGAGGGGGSSALQVGSTNLIIGAGGGGGAGNNGQGAGNGGSGGTTSPGSGSSGTGDNGGGAGGAGNGTAGDGGAGLSGSAASGGGGGAGASPGTGGNGSGSSGNDHSANGGGAGGDLVVTGAGSLNPTAISYSASGTTAATDEGANGSVTLSDPADGMAIHRSTTSGDSSRAHKTVTHKTATHTSAISPTSSTTDTTTADRTATAPSTTAPATTTTTTTTTATTTTSPTSTDPTTTTPTSTGATSTTAAPDSLKATTEGLSTPQQVLFFAVLGGSVLGVIALLTMPIPRRRRARRRRSRNGAQT